MPLANAGAAAAATGTHRSSTNTTTKLARGKPDAEAIAEKKAERKRAEEQERNRRISSLAPNSIFADDLPSAAKPAATPGLAKKQKDEQKFEEYQRDPNALELVLNPRPKARLAWQRRMVIRSIQKRGRLTKTEKLAKTERSHVVKSGFWKTSIKKLAPLARQIAGKTIDEAILQMRFSKKKAAQEIRAHLIQARNEAIVVRGMGVSAVPAALPLPKYPPPADSDPSASRAEVMTSDPSTLPVALETHNPTLSLKRTQTTPETQIYIDQAWVNRGAYSKSLSGRARGRMDVLRHPTTGLSVLLKEERTRMREKQEKEDTDKRKRLGKQLWTQLPDRKVYAQRPYYTW